MFTLGSLLGILLFGVASVVGRSSPLRRRSATIASSAATASGRRPRTLDREARTFEIQFSSETPCQMFSFERDCLVAEVLVAEGGEPMETVQLREQHQRGTGPLVGAVRNPHVEGDVWVGIAEIARTARGDELLNLVEDGHLSDVSVGYLPLETEYVEPGEFKFIGGREWHNPYAIPMAIVTRWRFWEVSLVDMGADPTAKIRSNNVDGNGGIEMSSVAIHSRASVTGRAGVGTMVSAAMLHAGVSDPSRCRAAVGGGGQLVRIEPSVATEREADEAAARFANRSPHLLIRAALELGGVRVRGYDPVTIVGAAWQATQGGRSASNAPLAALYLNTFASLMLSGWDAAGDSTFGWVSEADNLNYRPQPANRLSGGELTLHAQGGVAEHFDVELASETAQVARYSGQYELSEEDVINSASGGMLLDAAIGQQVGVAARALRPNLIYSTLLRNPTMADGRALFHEDHGNVEGGDLDDDGLTGMATLIGRQQENGVALNLRGDYLVCPVELERTAGKRVVEVFTGDGEATRPPIVRSDSRLDNGLRDPLTGQTHEGSETRWFMASRQPGHGLECRYLAGTDRMPQLSVGFLDRGSFGVWIAIKHTLGVVMLGWKGLARCDVETSS